MTVRKYNKRRRLPNGFGQITEIKGKFLRNPFRAMVTVGKTETGRPISKLLQPVSYFQTYNEAYAALVEYHKNPYEVSSQITMKELYEEWSKKYFETLNSTSSVENIMHAWRHCSMLYDMKVSDVRIRHIKTCINEGTLTTKSGKIKKPSANTKTRIKSVLNQLFDYAVEYELVDRNYARDLSLPNEVVKETGKVSKAHIAFTDEEMNILWSHVEDTLYVDVILIQCYSGWRPQELGKLEISRVDLDNWIFSGGMKTDAGTDRSVPIHPKIRHLVEAKYRQALSLGSKHLINSIDSKRPKEIEMTYGKYSTRFEKIRDELGLNPNHRPHDPRKQFVTLCKRYNVDEYAIKYMVGHVINDITERVYTERDSLWLEKEIRKIK